VGPILPCEIGTSKGYLLPFVGSWHCYGMWEWSGGIGGRRVRMRRVKGLVWREGDDDHVLRG